MQITLNNIWKNTHILGHPYPTYWDQKISPRTPKSYRSTVEMPWCPVSFTEAHDWHGSLLLCSQLFPTFPSEIEKHTTRATVLSLLWEASLCNFWCLPWSLWEKNEGQNGFCQWWFPTTVDVWETQMQTSLGFFCGFTLWGDVSVTLSLLLSPHSFLF